MTRTSDSEHDEPASTDAVAGVDEREASRTARIYAGYAESRRRRRTWASDNRGNVAIRKELTEALLEAADRAIQDGGRVLDVGCGSGWWLRELARRGVEPERLHGVDLLTERVEAARALLPGADIRRGDALELPYRDGSFRLVTLVVVLGSLPNAVAVARALSEACRVLAPGGRLAVYEPRYANPLNPHTRVVSAGEQQRVLGVATSSRTMTLAPPLARFGGGLPQGIYATLARFPFLRTHRLTVYERSTSHGD